MCLEFTMDEEVWTRYARQDSITRDVTEIYIFSSLILSSPQVCPKKFYLKVKNCIPFLVYTMIPSFQTKL